MDLKHVRRGIGFFYVLLVLLSGFVGFQYSNDTDNYYRENYQEFNRHWTVDGEEIKFPYGGSGNSFTIKNTLPVVYGDQFVVVRAYYDNCVVTVDGKVQYESTENTFMGRVTQAGNKEFWIPLWADDSGKEISIDITMKKELYGADITEAFITTRAEYGIRVLKANLSSLIVFAAFTVTGIIEIIIAISFAGKRFAEKRKNIFQALFYAGVFSVFSAQWIVNDCRLPFIVFGHIVGFSILTIISFLGMPLLFYRMQRCLFDRQGKFDCFVDNAITLISTVAVAIALFGVIDWSVLIYLGQAIDFIVLVVVGYYSVDNILHKETKHESLAVSYANVSFVVLAILALILYINSILSNYAGIIVLDLHLYVIVQVVIIYKRIGRSISEEQEFAKAKIYAFHDELTQLGNRRKFYQTLYDMDSDILPKDFTIIVVDSNRLKFYNDTMGHEAGDEVILGTAECLNNAFSNLAGVNICRIGGDEFAISALASDTQVEEAISIFKNMMAQWRGKYVNGLTAAVGYVSAGDYPELSVMALQGKADEKMYEDKKKFYQETKYDRDSIR